MLLDFQIGITIGDDFAVLSDLNCFPIQHSDADATTAKFDHSIRWRKPALEGWLRRIVLNRYLHIGFSERLNIDAILTIGGFTDVRVCQCSRQFFGPNRLGPADFRLTRSRRWRARSCRSNRRRSSRWRNHGRPCWRRRRGNLGRRFNGLGSRRGNGCNCCTRRGSRGDFRLCLCRSRSDSLDI